MLIPITEKDGRQTWLNPLHVRWVRSNRGMLGGEKPGAAIGVGDDTPVETLEEPRGLALRLGAALSTVLGAGVLVSSLVESHQKRSSDGDGSPSAH